MRETVLADTPAACATICKVTVPSPAAADGEGAAVRGEGMAKGGVVQEWSQCRGRTLSIAGASLTRKCKKVIDLP
jgi:hypothetical protein